MNRLLWIVFLFPLLATAKEKKVEKKATPERTCRIVYLTPPADAPQKLFLFDGTASREVELPEMNLSEVYHVAAGEVVLSLAPGAVEKADQVPQGAPNAKLEASVGDFYLVVTPDPSNKVVPVKMQVMDAGPKFQQGQMMWYNLTSSTITGELGAKKLELKGQAHAVVEDPAKANEPFDVNLSYLVPDDPSPHPIIQTKWIHDPRARMVMFAYGAENGNAPKVIGFKDFRETEEKKKEKGK